MIYMIYLYCFIAVKYPEIDRTFKTSSETSRWRFCLWLWFASTARWIKRRSLVEDFYNLIYNDNDRMSNYDDERLFLVSLSPFPFLLAVSVLYHSFSSLLWRLIVVHFRSDHHLERERRLWSPQQWWMQSIMILNGLSGSWQILTSEWKTLQKNCSKLVSRTFVSWFRLVLSMNGKSLRGFIHRKCWLMSIDLLRLQAWSFVWNSGTQHHWLSWLSCWCCWCRAKDKGCSGDVVHNRHVVQW